MKVFFALILNLAVLLGSTACSTSRYRPCSTGGQAPYETPPTDLGRIKRCYRSPDQDGKLVNDGKYFEWYSNDRIAVVGEYKMGKKTGRWIEFDPRGIKVSDRYFEDGKEIPRP